MTPKQYLDRYTYLKFFSPWNNAQVEAGITGYGSGWGTRGDKSKLGGQCQSELAAFTRALRIAHHGNANTSCGARFKFDQRPLGLIPDSEEFFPETFIHAFCGKGSPDEMIDTLRIAMAIGRIGSDRDAAGYLPARTSAADYAAAFMTLDCNGLVGNFYRVNPDQHISNYASAARRRTSIADVRVGDCVVTHSASSPSEHIGLIQEWSGNGASATVRVVEWGWYGDESEHYSRPMQVQVTTGPVKPFGIGWATTSNKDAKASFRYIFAPTTMGVDPFGWS